MSMDLSVVVPVYGSAPIVEELARRLRAALEPTGWRWEVLLVDDDSPDGAWHRILAVCEADPRFRGLRLMRNQGQHIATLCGMDHASGGLVVTMDDDLQHRPEDIPRLVAALDDDLDCVMAAFPRKRHGPLRNLGSRLVSWLNRRAYRLPAGVRLSTFRVLRGSLVRRMRDYRVSRPAVAQLIFLSTSRVANIELPHEDRYAGRSGYTMVRTLRLALDHFLNASNIPLRAITVTGLLACVGSLAVGCWVLVRALAGDVGVPGWASVMVLQAFLFGVLLLGVGMLSEYLHRLLHDVRTGACYALREDTGSDP